MMNPEEEPKMSPPPVPIDTLPRIEFVEMNVARWSGESDVPLQREPMCDKNYGKKRLDDCLQFVRDLNRKSLDRANKRFHKRMPDGYYIQDDCFNIIKSFLLKPNWVAKRIPYNFKKNPVYFRVNYFYRWNSAVVMKCIKKTDCFVSFRKMNFIQGKIGADGINVDVIFTYPEGDPLKTKIFKMKYKKRGLQNKHYHNRKGDSKTYEIENNEYVDIEREDLTGEMSAHNDLIIRNEFYTRWGSPLYFDELKKLRPDRYEDARRICWGGDYNNNWGK